MCGNITVVGQQCCCCSNGSDVAYVDGDADGGCGQDGGSDRTDGAFGSRNGKDSHVNSCDESVADSAGDPDGGGGSDGGLMVV